MTIPNLLAVFAHPDDETFRCGGLLALLARRGVRIQVLTATRGQAGSCGDPPLCTRDELPGVREQELRCACAAMGLEPPLLLDYQDGQLSTIAPEKIVADILAVVKRIQPRVILSYGPGGLSGHPDHIAIGQCAAAAYERADEVTALYTLTFPQSLARLLGMTQLHTMPDERISIQVDVSSAWDAKLAAIRCHRTQLGQSPILNAPEEKQRLFLAKEFYYRQHARHANDFLVSLFTTIKENNL